MKVSELIKVLQTVSPELEVVDHEDQPINIVVDLLNVYLAFNADFGEYYGHVNQIYPEYIEFRDRVNNVSAVIAVGGGVA